MTQAKVEAAAGAAQRIPGLVRSDGEAHQRAARLNRLMISMNSPAVRAEFAANPAAVMDRHGLDAQERELLARADWPALLARGASVYALAKMARAFEQSLLDVGASMRGCSVADLKKMLPLHEIDSGAAHG